MELMDMILRTLLKHTACSDFRSLYGRVCWSSYVVAKVRKEERRGRGRDVPAFDSLV
jgi:hypothetical protein